MLNRQRWLSALVLAVFLFGLFPLKGLAAAASEQGPFLDLIGTSYETPVNQLHALKIVSGLTPTMYGWDQGVTRAQMAALVTRAVGRGDAKAENGQSFTDVPLSHWAYNQVELASQSGLILGYGNGKYGPDDPVTYAQAAVMLLRATGQITRVQGEYPEAHILVAREAGLLDGVEAAANESLNRGQVALLVWNAVFKVEDPSTALTLSQRIFKVATEVSISPADGHLTASSTQLFVIGKDWVGRPLTLDATQWRVVSGSGSITGGGTLTVTDTNPVTVEATVGSLKATRTFTLRGSRLEVTPAAAACGVGEMVAFSAMAVTSDGLRLAVPVEWSASNGIMGSDGRFMAATSGRATVKAKSGNLEAIANVVVWGEPQAVAISASETRIPANGSATSTVTARVVDGSGSTVEGDYQFTFYLSSSHAATGSLTATTVHSTDGTATTTFKAGTRAGSAVVRAVVSNLKVSSSAVTIATTAPAVESVDLTASPTNVVPGGSSRANVIATLVDSNGVPIANPTGSNITIRLTQSDTTAGRLESSSITIRPGQTTASAVFRSGAKAGTTTITGEAAYPVTPVTITSEKAGPLSRLAVTVPEQSVAANGVDSMTVRVELQDEDGLVRAGDSSTQVYLTAVSGSTSLSISPVRATYGVATFTITSTKAGTFDIRAAADGVESDEVTALFRAGTPVRLAVSAEPVTTLSADLKSTTDLVARVLDQNGNLVTDQVFDVRFSKTSDSRVTVFVDDVRTARTEDGIARVTLRSTAKVGTDRFTASAEGLQTVGSPSITTKITGAPHKLGIQSAASGTVGKRVSVKVMLLDSRGDLVTGADDVLVSLTSDSSTAVIDSPQITESGVATFYVTDTRAESITLTATADDLIADDSGKTITFTAGAADRIILRSNPASLAADGRSQARITADVVDAEGNVVSGSQRVDLAVDDEEIASLSSGYLTTGERYVTLRSTRTPGTVTITGDSSDGYWVEPLTISTYIAGEPVAAVVEEPSSGVAGEKKTVRVRIVDDNGNTVTSLSTGYGSDLTAVGLTVTGASGTTTISNTGSTGLKAHGFSPDGIAEGAVPVVSGVATFAYTNTRAETVRLVPTVFYEGEELEAVSASATTVAGPAAKLTITPESPTLAAEWEEQIDLVIAITDENGNLVSAGSETVTLQTSSSRYVTLEETSVQLVNGSAAVTAESVKRRASGTTTITATTSQTGLTGSTTIYTDVPPAAPYDFYAVKPFGSGTTVTGFDDAIKVGFSAQSRSTPQTVHLYVNGETVPIYSSTRFNNEIDTLGSGETSFEGYIKVEDLGGKGLKQLQAALSNGLGFSPMSEEVEITYK